MKTRLISMYVGIGVGIAVASAAVLLREGKNTPAQIAYYSTMNGAVWPVALVFMEKKRQELASLAPKG